MKKNEKMPVFYIVIPCYNEESCISETSKQMAKKIDQLVSAHEISDKSRVVYVDDGSKDKTWQLIKELREPFIGVKLAHNRGHQNALVAGMSFAKDFADVIVTIDADLQDDINAIDKMVEKFKNGAEIVYGVRNDRKSDSVFKRTTAQGFYKVMSFLGVETVYNAADYRLMSNRAVSELLNYGESNLFLRGIVTSIGLKTDTVEYVRSERFAGESKYPLKKMLNFAWDGITSFSVKPLSLILGLGVFIFLASLISFVWNLFIGASTESFLPCSIWMATGVQIIAFGVIGSYIGKIYTETKQRPRFMIEEIVGKPSNEK